MKNVKNAFNKSNWHFCFSLPEVNKKYFSDNHFLIPFVSTIKLLAQLIILF